MTDLVIDASVAMKWVIDEPRTEQALALRCTACSRRICSWPNALTSYGRKCAGMS